MKKEDEYPLVLGSKEVGEILGKSKNTVYKIMRQDNFPLIPAKGQKLVYRDKFFEWMKAN